MKVCTQCKCEKELHEFSKKKTAKDGRSSACKVCRRTKYRVLKFCTECGAECEFNTKHKYCIKCKSNYDADRKLDIKTRYKKYISDLGCLCCGFNHPDALEVHHLSKEYKRFGTSQSQSNQYNLIDIAEDKAIVLCANCHLIFHSYFGGRSSYFPPQTKESTVEIINNSRRIKS